MKTIKQTASNSAATATEATEWGEEEGGGGEEGRRGRDEGGGGEEGRGGGGRGGGEGRRERVTIPLIFSYIIQ